MKINNRIKEITKQLYELENSNNVDVTELIDVEITKDITADEFINIIIDKKIELYKELIELIKEDKNVASVNREIMVTQNTIGENTEELKR